MSRDRFTLVSFVGTHDPYGKEEACTGGFPYGPIITSIKIAKEKGIEFGRVYILSTEALVENAEQTKEEIKSNFSEVEVVIFYTELEDPTDHIGVFEAIERFVREYKEDLYEPNNEIYVALTSGTPAIHACLLLSCASQILRGKLIHLKEARYTSSKLPEYRVIDLTDSRFPRVSSEFSLRWILEARGDEPPKSFESFGIIGTSERLIQECQKAWRYAKSGVINTILIIGETGTGKELVANLVAKVSGRDPKKYQARNINDYSSELLRSELFGYLKGSFTGAFADKEGLLTVLNGGTLFLDEIGDCSREIQSQLLRAIEYGEYSPVGSNRVFRTDVLFVFATNRNPLKLIESGSWRRDFYYRINKAVVNLPPLRERSGDIALLVEHFIRQQYNKRPVPYVPRETMKKLMAYQWPGNIRELKTTLERAIALIGEDAVITPDLIQFDEPSELDFEKYLPIPHEGFKLGEYLDEVSCFLKKKALEVSAGNASKAAELLGITPQAMWQFVKKLKGKENVEV